MTEQDPQRNAAERSPAVLPQIHDSLVVDAEASIPATAPPPETANPHPDYGPCDRLRPDGSCAECHARKVGYRSPEPVFPATLIERATLDPSVDVEKLARLMDLQERYIKRQDELAFNTAKGRILKELAGVRIVKNKWVQYPVEKNNPKAGVYDAFKYAPLEEIDRVLGPLLAREEMDLSYSDEPQPDGRIMIRGRLKHLPGGHYEDSFMAAPLDTSGGKNNVQAVGSSNSYLRRYVACNIFNIVVVGDDDDGAGGPITEDQVAEILTKMREAKAGPKYLKYMRLLPIEESGSPQNSVAAMPARDYRKALNALEDLIAKARPTGAETHGATSAADSRGRSATGDDR